MADKFWKLLMATFIIVASQAVLFVGMMLGSEMVGLISVVVGLIGIVVGIILGVGTIVNSRGQNYGE